MQIKKFLTIILIIAVCIIVILCVKINFKRLFSRIYPPYVFVTEWENPGYHDKQIEGRIALAVDSKGYVYIQDCGGIYKLNTNGNFMKTCCTEGETYNYFINPRRIVLDIKDNLYVVDCTKNCIKKFNNNGEFVTKFGNNDSTLFYQSNLFLRPEGIAIDSKGCLYVTDSKSYIQKLDSEGNLLEKIETPELPLSYYNLGDIEDYNLGDIEIDSFGNIYVVYYFWEKGVLLPVDLLAYSCIYKLNSSGNIITRWGPEGSKDVFFNQIVNMTIDLKGNVLVSDSYNNCIQIFDSEGNFISKLDIKGTEKRKFGRISEVVVDSKGNLYVADFDNHCIQKFKPKLSFMPFSKP